ncbi:pyridoxal phosphate-dependent decarboxylase family protein [Actinophytocola gossypii]|uniref:Aminotransferase class I/II-fold pyridoxal phosphate-dependent enzyme n=1 Tax=Actinophytocola gossypii TaxID=2812003 RepID=A0ABT2J5X3_9PSEU|nr:aminotransferase class I/II-fold pyridoxal phosphate-dependent enzyme [Actinophytocola gossypii]MCT2582994.1 aminotransferase class I/II-fold pyridoxal phosphate-dependent enzyme [Actinophytocola gossypii]
MTELSSWLREGVEAVEAWQRTFADRSEHPAQRVDPERFRAAFTELTERLTDNYPFFHPDYAGQMLKPPHPVAVAGYLTTMLVNPNNHAVDGGPATARMEREAVAALATMFGFDQHLGHLTGGGTVANLEALFVARESHPGRGVAFSTESHYTHARMCQVLGMPGYTVPVDDTGRMDLDALEELLATGKVGTVVLTAGTTGLGAVDPIHEALALRDRYGVRLHVDAAYGGFFTLLADSELVDPRPWRAIAGCDSVVVDPHKHGLQPYGCGAVLFADPTVARFYRHDSPYTYFTDADLHLGEISLECSRPGAAAAALWLTFQVIPPTPDGLGRFVAASRRAALRWADLLADSPHLALYQRPELDIVAYFPRRNTLSDVDAAAARAFTDGMNDKEDPVYLSVLTVDAADLARRHPDVKSDADRARILRSVLMKPESEDHVDRLHRRVERLVR